MQVFYDGSVLRAGKSRSAGASFLFVSHIFLTSTTLAKGVDLTFASSLRTMINCGWVLAQVLGVGAWSDVVWSIQSLTSWRGVILVTCG